jgi:UDP-glucose 4-epimerase
MKKVLVTGGRGFVGRHILNELVTLGFDVHAIASHSDISEDLIALPVTWHVCDLMKPEAAEALVKQVGPSHMIHAAWVTDHGDYWNSRQNLDWLATTAALLKAFAEVGGARYVGIGTCAEYEWTSSTYDEELTPELPATYYGNIKLEAHRVAMKTAEFLGFSAATGRIFFAYGPHENPKRILPYTCQKLALGEPVKISNGALVRDFLHVKDVGAGFATLLNSDLRGAVNIASGVPQALSELVDTVAKIANRPDLIDVNTQPSGSSEPLKLVAKIDRISSTGWQPRIQIEQGLRETYEWWHNQVKNRSA